MLKLRHGGKKKFFSNIERTSAPSSSSSVLQWCYSDEIQLFLFLWSSFCTILFHSLSIPSPLFLPSLLRQREKEKKGDPYQSAEISDECLRKYSGRFVSFRSFEIKEGRKKKTNYKLTQPSGITVLSDREQWKVWYIQMEYKIIIIRRK